jgi:hypothetical protein
MPDGLKNSNVNATIVFVTTRNSLADWMNEPNSSSLDNSTTADRMSWSELVHSRSGAWAEVSKI